MKIVRYYLLTLGLLLLSKWNYAYDKSYVDSINTEIATIPIDSAKFNKLNTLFIYYYEEYILDSLLTTSLAMNEIAENNYPKGISQSLRLIAVAYQMKEMYPQSMKFVKKTLLAQKKEGDKVGMSESINNMGWLYKEQGKYPKAIDCFINALNLAEEINDSTKMAICLDNIGHINMKMDKLEKAKEYYKRGLSISRKLKKEKLIARGLNNIAIVYKKLNKLDSALSTYLECATLGHRINNKKGEATTLNNIAKLYLYQKEYQKAKDYTQKALKIHKEIKSKTGLIVSNLTMGRVLSAQGKTVNGIKFLKDGLSLALEMKDKTLIMNSYNHLNTAFAQVAKFDSAYVYLQFYHQVKDSLLSIENSEMIANVTTKYETEKKDQQIALLNKEKELQAVGIEKMERTRNGFIVGFVLLSFLIVVLLINYREKQKSKRLILSKNLEVKKQQDLIVGQEIERQRIAKDLHDGLCGSLAAIKLNLGNINKSVNNKNIESVIINISDAYSEVRNISHNLMPVVLKDKKFIPAIEEYLGKFKLNKKMKIQFDCFGKNELNKLSTNIQSDIYRIIQELVNNVIKHSLASKMDVSLSIEDNHIDLMVEDNGIGFNTNTQKKGIGLNNINSRVQLLGAKLNIDSKKDRGSSFHIQFSVHKKYIDTLVV